MQRTHVYLPEELNQKIDYAARLRRTSKANVMREALTHGLRSVAMPKKKSKPNNGLLELAEIAKKLDSRGPKDLSTNLDKYLWDE
jgi:metal-responsive CopG/Arc/MetJ family transcriptional regulator